MEVMESAAASLPKYPRIKCNQNSIHLLYGGGFMPEENANAEYLGRLIVKTPTTELYRAMFFKPLEGTPRLFMIDSNILGWHAQGSDIRDLALDPPLNKYYRNASLIVVGPDEALVEKYFEFFKGDSGFIEDSFLQSGTDRHFAIIDFTLKHTLISYENTREALLKKGLNHSI
ncbi:MAG: hypothetical protein NTU57_02915 [Candidatus Aenigmarchaeota archaeon]|nr:hypothetical protein [Candidatus Aenigmarchaeota archaeon]